MGTDTADEEYEKCSSCEGTGKQKNGFSEQTLEFSYGSESCYWCKGRGEVPRTRN